ncbi:MAG TPA: hypothetical protein VE268_06870, partial [Herpetosiphonaceae bacterium]|nr:hypothetical protein [Herpetosiphonaceae bacterium]
HEADEEVGIVRAVDLREQVGMGRDTHGILLPRRLLILASAPWISLWWVGAARRVRRSMTHLLPYDEWIILWMRARE